MNIKVTLTNNEAVNLLTPIFQDKHDTGNFGGRPTVEVAIDPITPSTYTPPSVASRLSFIRDAFRRESNGYLNKIGMIKEVRTLTGWGLKDSKDFVEAMLSGLNL
jgi:hypothetical protein